MNKALNFIVIIFGISLIILGVLKLTIGLEKIPLTLGDSYINIPLSPSLFFIIMVNFLGGFTFIFHAVKTLTYKKERLEIKSESNIIDEEDGSGLSEMSRPIMLSGSYSLIIGLWFMLATGFFLYLGFKFGIGGYVELFTLAFIVSLACGLTPIMLVSKNISLSSRIRKRKDRERTALFHSKIKSHSKNRRR